LKSNGTHQVLDYADYVNISGGSVCTIKENADAVVVANKKSGLEGKADKTKYMAMYRDQNAGRNHNIETDNNSFEGVEELKFGNKFNISKFYSERNYELLEVRECLLSFGAESLVSQFAIQKYKD
jgi:hypothetical protein